jgi:predicted PurR-regulated permease PerM
MSQTTRYIISSVMLILLACLIWYFSHIVIYIIVSLVLALIGRPFFDLLGKARFRKLYLPAGVRALFTMVLIMSLILSFFGMLIPLLAGKISTLSSLDPAQLINAFSGAVTWIENFVNRYHLQSNEAFSMQSLIQESLAKLNFSQIAGLFGSVAWWLGSFTVALFSVAFMTFFFLKDEGLFSRNLLLLVPEGSVQAFSNALESIHKLLSRYFIGMLVEISAVVLLSTVGLLLIGFPFRDALLIGFLSGIFNIIPYLGPLIGTVLGVFVGVVSALARSGQENLIVVACLTILVFVLVQFIDNWLIQPYIYSNSVYAHPLEIFLVFLMAGSFGGLAGMMFAVPAYTVIRVFAREFLSNFRFVQSLTKNIT